MSNSKPTILFDLDGTLVDNFDAIYASYHHTQEQLGLNPATYEVVRRTVGGSLPITMRRLLKDDFVEDAIDIFNAYFDRHFTRGLRLLPGARELLHHLYDPERRKLAVFTNKNHRKSRQVCDYLEITEYLDAVEGSERPEGYRKPNRDFSDHVLRILDADPGNTIMIGDSPFDAEAARVVAMQRVYLVGTGTHSVDELRDETDADAVYPDLIELGRAVFDLPRDVRLSLTDE